MAPHEVGQGLQFGVHVAAQPTAGLEALGLGEQGGVTEHPKQVGLHVTLHTPVFGLVSLTASKPSPGPSRSQPSPGRGPLEVGQINGYKAQLFERARRLSDPKPYRFKRETKTIPINLIIAIIIIKYQRHG